MGDGEAADQLGGGGGGASSSPRAGAHNPAGSEDEDYDDLYGDVGVGFVPLLPLSPSPSPSSPPKTPSLRLTPSPSPPPRRSPDPEPRPVHEPEPQPKPSAPQYQPPRPPSPAAPTHQVTPPQPQRPLRLEANSSSPPGRALYISELPWWATDAEVEAALALVPDAAPALCGLFFYSDKYNGKSRGICRADFTSPAVAAAAAAALNGRAFHGRNCVASLSRPAVLTRLNDDSDAETPVRAAPNPSRGRGSLGVGRGGTNTTPVRGNVDPILGDRQGMAPHPQHHMVPPRPHGLPFGGPMEGGGGGYGGFPQPLGQFNPGMGTGMMQPHMNPAFLAAGGMPMRGPGMWPDQAMDGSFWGAQRPPWNMGGGQFPWQQQAPLMQAQQHQQQHADGDYGKGRGMRRGRPGRSDERGIGNVNVRNYPERRQSDHDGGDLYKEHDREERSRHRDRSPQREREPERRWDEGDRRLGNRRRYQEYSEDDEDDRRVRTRSKSQSRNDGYDDQPRRRR